MKHVFSKDNKALLTELVRTDFKLRYQNSVLGYAWSLLRPLLLFLILYIVFVKFLKIGNSVPHYPIYLLLGIVLWNFFAEMTSQSLGSIVGRGDLIRKVLIPRWIIVISSSISALINLGLNLIVVMIFMIFNHVAVGKGIIFFPLLLLEIYIYALGLSFFLSAAFVKFRDMNYIWEVIMQALFYLTPILYPLSIITSKRFLKLLLLNPMAQAIQDSRKLLVTKSTTTITEAYGTKSARAVVIAAVLLIFISGALYFRRESKYFAENI